MRAPALVVDTPTPGGGSGPRKAKPLTGHFRNGEPYFRRREVEDQIVCALALTPGQLLEALKLRSQGASGFLKEEVLVYLAREYWEVSNDLPAGDPAKPEMEMLCSAVTAELTRRCSIVAANHIRLLAPRLDVPDCCADIIGALFMDLCGPNPNVYEYAQLYFNQFFRRLSRDVIDRNRGKLVLDPIDEPENENGSLPESIIEDLRSSSPETAAMIGEALSALDPRFRELLLLYHVYGYSLESKDAQVMTLEQRFGVTARTLRTWLRTAERELAERLGRSV